MREIVSRQLADEVFADVRCRFVVDFGHAFHELDSLAEELLTGTAIGKKQQAVRYEMLNTNLTTELTHLLPKIAVPVLILWGEDDKFQLVKYAERLAADIPGARLMRIHDARHFLMFDQAAQVASEVSAFISTR